MLQVSSTIAIYLGLFLSLRNLTPSGRFYLALPETLLSRALSSPSLGLLACKTILFACELVAWCKPATRPVFKTKHWLLFATEIAQPHTCAIEPVPRQQPE